MHPPHTVYWHYIPTSSLQLLNAVANDNRDLGAMHLDECGELHAVDPLHQLPRGLAVLARVLSALLVSIVATVWREGKTLVTSVSECDE